MPSVDAAWRFLRLRHEQDNRAAFGAHFAAQHDDAAARQAAGAAALLSSAWDDRLSATLFDRNRAAAGDFSQRVARGFGRQFDPEVMDEWLSMNAALGAESINNTTRARLAAADVDEVFAGLTRGGGRLEQIAASTASTATNFGAHDAARASGATMKVWQVTSGNPRSTHSAMNGATVGIHELFRNGMRWPGDPAGGAGEVANCQCALAYIGGE